MINWKIYHFDEVDSTNNLARKYSKGITKQYLIIHANKQTAGRGRWGRNWYSLQGNLFFSALLEFPLQHLGKLVIISSLSLYQALKSLCIHQNIQLKWPNDILIDNAKVSGILLEKAEGDYFIVGIGVNIAQSPSSENLIYPVTSLYEKAIITTPNAVLQTFLQKFTENLCHFNKFGIETLRKQWLSGAKGLGQKIVIRQENKEIYGQFIGIDDDANLLLQTPEGINNILIGDVFYTEEDNDRI